MTYKISKAKTPYTKRGRKPGTGKTYPFLDLKRREQFRVDPDKRTSVQNCKRIHEALTGRRFSVIKNVTDGQYYCVRTK